MITPEMNGGGLWAILAALLPAFVMLAYVFWYDRAHPEPIAVLFKGFVCGIVSVGLLYLLWNYFPDYFEWADSGTSVLDKIKDSVFSAAIPEETVKLLMFWILVSKNHFFDQRFDGIVYAVSVGMGFAALENIDYVFFYAGPLWGSVAAARAVLSVPGHYIMAVMMGYFYSVAKYKREKRWKRLWQLSLIWMVPVLIHGTYDAIAMNMKYSDTVYIILTIALFVFCYVLHKLCNRLIQKQLLADCENGVGSKRWKHRDLESIAEIND